MEHIMNLSTTSVPQTQYGCHHHEEVKHSELDEEIDIFNFYGHIFPGLAFMSLGLWWAYCSFNRYFLCSRDAKLGKENPRPFVIALTHNSKLSKWIPVEPTVGMVGSLLGFVMEAFHYEPQKYILHNMLYTSFGVICFFEFLRCRGYGLDRGVIYFILCMTLFGNFMLLLTHAYHPHSALITQVHYRLLAILAEGIILVCVEIKNMNNIVSCLCRGHFMLFYGLWWNTIAHLIYPIYMDRFLDDSQRSLVLIDMIFVAEIYLSFFIVLIIAAVTYLKVRKLSGSQLAAELDYEFALDDYLARLNNASKHRIVMSNECEEPLLSSSEEGCCSIKGRCFV